MNSVIVSIHSFKNVMTTKKYTLFNAAQKQIPIIQNERTTILIGYGQDFLFNNKAKIWNEENASVYWF